MFNPFTLEVYFTISFLIVPQLILIYTTPVAKDSFYSDIVILVYVSSLFLGTLINVKPYPIKGIQNVNVINFLNLLLYSLLLLPLVPFLLRFGFSLEGFRNFYETVVFTRYASFYELSKFVLYFIIFLKLIKKQRFTIGFFILFPLIFMYGSRFVILDFLIYLIVYLEQFKGLGAKKIALFCLIGGTLIGIFSFVQFSPESFHSLFVSYFDIYKNQSFIVGRLLEGKMDYYYGEIYFSSYLKFIPRFLWADKPKEFGFAILNYDIFPVEAARGYMPSFGLGSLFADFGFFSILIWGVVSGFVRNYLYRTFKKSRNNFTFFLYVFSLTFITNVFLILYLWLDYTITSLSKRDQPQIRPA